MGDNCIYFLNEEMDSIAQKSKPLQKSTWKFYFLIYFVHSNGS